MAVRAGLRYRAAGWLAAALVPLGVAAGPAAATVIVDEVTATASGWFLSDGTSDPDRASQSYLTGRRAGLDHRGFVAFDIPDLRFRIQSATLRLENPRSFSDDPTETLRLSLLRGASVAGVLDGTGGVRAYDDLGRGGLTVLVVDPNASPDLIEVPISSRHVKQLNFERGGSTVAFGLSMFFDGSRADQFLFADSGALSVRSLELVSVTPLPAAAWLGGGALALLGLMARRHTRAGRSGAGDAAAPTR